MLKGPCTQYVGDPQWKVDVPSHPFGGAEPYHKGWGAHTPAGNKITDSKNAAIRNSTLEMMMVTKEEFAKIPQHTRGRWHEDTPITADRIYCGVKEFRDKKLLGRPNVPFKYVTQFYDNKRLVDLKAYHNSIIDSIYFSKDSLYGKSKTLSEKSKELPFLQASIDSHCKASFFRYVGKIVYTPQTTADENA